MDKKGPAKAPSQDPSGHAIGGGLPVIQQWANYTLSTQGPKVWQTLFHKSACLSCAWGTGGQKGGFSNELEEPLQRCAKSVEAIKSELQPAVKSHIFQNQTLAQLQQLTSQEADRLGRLSTPLILRAGKSHYEPIPWDEVYDLVETAFRHSPERVASYSSGRSSNEAAFLLQLLLRAMGSNNLADCSDLCHRASSVGLKTVFGTGTSMVSLESLKQADCVVLIGSNAPANHPRLMNELIKLRDRNGQIITLNPVKEVGLVKFGSPAFPLKSLVPGSEIASLFLQPIPGSDLAILVGIQKSLIDRGLIDVPFLQAHTENWATVIAQAQAASWEEIVTTCGVTQTEIETAATIISQSSRVVFAWAMGVTQQANGVETIFAIANTALMTGNAGKPGAGLMPIRGHSNVQGFGSMGVSNELKEEMRLALEKVLGKSLNRVPGYDARSLVEAADAGKVDTLLCLGGNFYAANPDLHQAKRALGQVDTVIYLATKPNLGHFHGLARKNTLIIPVYARFENPHKTTVESGNNFVRLNDPGTTHLKNADLVAEVDFITELAYRLFGDSPVDWRQLKDTHYVRQLIAQTIPGYGAIATIDQTNQEFTIAGRIFNTPHFPTPSGKAQMQPTAIPTLTLPLPQDFDGPDQGLVVALITGRSYGQHNTVVYRTDDRYRGMPHRHCILMNPDDVAQAGWAPHQRVTVQGDADRLENIEIICGAIRRGAALMFYPEANVLMKARVDVRSQTPAYKRVPVLVYQP
ncbi:FdhF/YdeP family oxidoreductase [Leptothoe sp. PORK10 BA2]|uniref:FdhF/YdeP family oxidoreductase n=1 Tax=Leptothoe sp. PORK10 BA2 TaxID=3110254 RepID=UPI002B20E395|nr:FdhF/YdeP family oxidoreductase [Leptothoe sp. PORK10 BA2]MEA5464332.1 FdhF/YdeP family oxidoreductase [Leptothoe sp. PORK10 BA2]